MRSTARYSLARLGGEGDLVLVDVEVGLALDVGNVDLNVRR
jgi:hypothetical protein